MIFLRLSFPDNSSAMSGSSKNSDFEQIATFKELIQWQLVKAALTAFLYLTALTRLQREYREYSIMLHGDVAEQTQAGHCRCAESGRCAMELGKRKG